MTKSNGVGQPGVSEMSYHQRPHELRLAISSEAEALISDFGGEADAVARRRAKEASTDFPGEGLERSRARDHTQNGNALVVARPDVSLAGGCLRHAFLDRWPRCPRLARVQNRRADVKERRLPASGSAALLFGCRLRSFDSRKPKTVRRSLLTCISQVREPVLRRRLAPPPDQVLCCPP
jgi:hypothetical protein